MLRHTIRDRFHVVARYVTPDRVVMDVGCVDARPARQSSAERIEYKPDALFKRIAECNPSVLGVDVDADGVRLLTEQGYHVVREDAETMDLGRRFDTVVAGELIEHLENPGRFLRNMRRHLVPGGVLILSTPNPFYAGIAWKIWRYGRPDVHEDHVGWQDPITLERLLRRTGFSPLEGYWVQPHRKWLKTWKRLLRPYFSRGFMLIAKAD